MKTAYPWFCGTCRNHALFPATVPYATEVQHDGELYQITFPALAVLKCEKCGSIVLGDSADNKITEEIRRVAGLLSGDEIRRNREKLGLTQKELGRFLDAGEATVSRWETGGQIQQRAQDKLLRLFFDLPEVRRELGHVEPPRDQSEPHQRALILD